MWHFYQVQLRRWLRVVGVISALVSALAATVSAAVGADVRAVQIGGLFSSPVYVTVAPGEPDLLFAVEQRGRIQIMRNEVRQAQPFLDISNLVYGPPDAGAYAEQGLFSVAFPPSYQKSGRFYVAFTNSGGHLVIAEYLRSAQNRMLADPASYRFVVAVYHPVGRNHNGGQLQFGPDHLLYISTGDGGSVNPLGEPARDLNSLLGKILRIIPLQNGAQRYEIPSSNPFVGKPGRDEIFSYGFRNPWRFSFDGSRIAIGDVGEHREEEVNLLFTSLASGANFGWPQYEGNQVFDDTRPGPHSPKFPILTYDHTNGRCSIVGGYVVRDRNLATLNGRYLYGDTCTGELRSFVPDVSAQRAMDDRSAGVTLPGLSSFGRGFGGRIYAAQLNGRISRLVADPSGATADR